MTQKMLNGVQTSAAHSAVKQSSDSTPPVTRPTVSQRFLHRFYRLRRGPHGSMVVGMLGLAVAVFPILLAGVVFEGFWRPAVAIGIAAFLITLNAGIALVNLLRAQMNDTHYAIWLEAGLRRAGYNPGDFFTDGAAANPSLQLLNLKILRLCRPLRILELGSGQTTKILSCYARANPGVYALSLEQDPDWVERLKEHVGHDYRHAALQTKDFACAGIKKRLATTWYPDLPEFRDGAFDYILVDGPDPGTSGATHTPYARSGILQYLPGILASSFVVVFDDAERYGEIMTVQALERSLKACGKDYVRFVVHGIKTQVVFCSPDRAFLRSV